MAWRGLHVSRPARLTLRAGQLVVSQEDGEVTVSIEDIAWLVLDTPQVSLTGSLLSALVEAGAVMLVPDDKHHPAGLLLPFHQHHAQSHIAHLQVEATQPLRKRLWQMLVIAKIQNQANLLHSLGRGPVVRLRAMAARVASGDPDNLEAQAARLYWSGLFDDFTRSARADRRNSLLNYGYAVLRAGLARACVAYGLLPTFGLHHASRTNPFNLVDDLIEPFRPFVDRLALARADSDHASSLSVEDRRHMAAILNEGVQLGGEQMTLLAGMEAVVASLVRAIEFASPVLLVLPALKPDR